MRQSGSKKPINPRSPSERLTCLLSSASSRVRRLGCAPRCVSVFECAARRSTAMLRRADDDQRSPLHVTHISPTAGEAEANTGNQVALQPLSLSRFPSLSLALSLSLSPIAPLFPLSLSLSVQCNSCHLRTRSPSFMRLLDLHVRIFSNFPLTFDLKANQAEPRPGSSNHQIQIKPAECRHISLSISPLCVFLIPDRLFFLSA